MGGVNATFDVGLFVQAIEGLGLRFRWSRAVVCPCAVNVDETQQPDPTCSVCAGSDGWRYVNPYLRENRHTTDTWSEVMAIFSRIALDPKLNQTFGPWGFGDAAMTVAGEHRVGYRDLFVGLDQEMPWTEIVLREAGTNVVLVGKTGRTTTAQKYALRYEPIRVNYVVDSAHNEFFQGVDFDIREATQTEPAKLVWRAGMGPVAGLLYSVQYVCHPVWVVDDATFGIQHLQGPAKGSRGRVEVQQLPTTFKVRLDYLTPQRGA